MRRPVNTARPIVAEMPQRKVAVAMYRYPRSGCALVDNKLVQTFRIEAYDHLIIDDGCRRGTAAIFINQVADCHWMCFYVALFVFDSPSREVGL